MPRNNREYLLRYADQMDNDLDRILQNCKRISELYGDVHPQHAEFFITMAEMLISTQQTLKDFRTNFM